MRFSSYHREFVPFPALLNRHLMTVVPVMWPRRLRFAKETGERRLFEVESANKVLAYCHWQKEPSAHATLVLVHGLEGCSESHYMLGTAEKAFACSMNVVRMNMRNCGGSLHLCRTLYNSGLSGDVVMLLRELRQTDGLKTLFLAGWSMGGNVVLKAAAELGQDNHNLLAGVCAISPSLDLAPCVDSLETGLNRLYEQRFLRGLKAKLKEKKKLFPEMYDLTKLHTIRSVRQLDDLYTAPQAGYGSAANYYKSASALPIAHHIQVPTLIIQSQDDPFIPFGSFLSPKLKSPYVTLLATSHGGHAGFLQKDLEHPPLFDRFWAENRLVMFFSHLRERQTSCVRRPIN